MIIWKRLKRTGKKILEVEIMKKKGDQWEVTMTEELGCVYLGMRLCVAMLITWSATPYTRIHC